MTLRTWRRIRFLFALFVALPLLLMFFGPGLGYHGERLPLILMALFFGVAEVIGWALFSRCPHCHVFLRHAHTDMHCPHCHAHLLEKKETTGQ